MPHVTIEYTANLEPTVAFDDVFGRIHRMLAEVGGIRIGNCKSRAVRLDTYGVGEGGGDAFVHADVRFLEGRPAEVRERISRAALKVLADAFDGRTGVQITVEVRDIERRTYAKYPSGTLDAQ